MKYVIMAVFDVKAKSYSFPFYAPSSVIGIRNVSAAVNGNSGQSMLEKYPEDFRLFELGTFDDETGVCDMAVTPVIVCECSSLKKE